MRERLIISFSGGRTSAYMAQRLMREHPAKEKVVVFANTGQEHEATLQFVDFCDIAFRLNVVWIEAEVSPVRGEGVRARVVDFTSASRTGKPFEDVIAKYGIPNTNYPHCTRELKERPIRAYLRSIGWKAGTYDMAVGIRVDEFDRMSAEARKLGIIYPLVKWNVTKADVMAFWKTQPFDLELPEHLGNCTWCWKKSMRKHLTLARDYPEVFDFPRRMEQTHPLAGPGNNGVPRRFFRQRKTADDIIAMSREPFDKFVDPTFDLNDGCAESCEVFS